MWWSRSLPDWPRQSLRRDTGGSLGLKVLTGRINIAMKCGRALAGSQDTGPVTLPDSLPVTLWLDSLFSKVILGTSLVVQWLRIHLPMQGTRVRSLVGEDPTLCGATKPMRHNYWACALKPASHNCWSHVPQLLKPTCLEPMLCNKRSHCNEKPPHRNEE